MRVIAREAFAVGLKGGRVVSVKAGDVFDASDPVVKGREALFEPVDEWAARVQQGPRIEQATAAPGEKRSVAVPEKAKK